MTSAPTRRMNPVRKRILSGCLATALALTLTGCSFFQSDSSFFGKDQPSADSLTKDNLTRAHDYRLQKKYKQAIHILSQLTLASPDNGPVLAEYGKTLTEMGRSHEAVEFLNRAIKLTPNDWTLYSALGVVRDQLGQYDKAQMAFQTALRIKPGEPDILNNYALSCLMAGDTDAAQMLIREAMASGKASARVKQNAALIAEVLQAKATMKAQQPVAEQGKKNPPPRTAEAHVKDLVQKKAKVIISDPGPVPRLRPGSREEEDTSPLPLPRPEE